MVTLLNIPWFASPGTADGYCSARSEVGSREVVGGDHARAVVTRIVATVDRMRAVDLLSASLDPATGAIRVELHAPRLSRSEQADAVAGLRSVASDHRIGDRIQVEFVDEPGR
jgi:hypothetical protein